MKEAIANAGVFNFIIIFVVLLIAFFIGSLGYSKAFKVKNMIVSEIEKEEEYSDAVIESVENSLSEIGYRVITNDSNFKCPDYAADGKTVNLVSDKSNSIYQYCVYEVRYCPMDKYSDKDDDNFDSTVIAGYDDTFKKCSTYYRVIAYMYFDVPVVSDLIRIPVIGETKTFSERYS